MKHEFRLATVERLRGARVQDAGRAVHAAGQALTAALARRDALSELLHARPAAGRQVLTHDQLQRVEFHRDRVREELAAALTDVGQLTEGLAAARTHWLAARAELQAVESLHQRHRLAVQAHLARGEQKELDELASNRSAFAKGRS